MVGRLCLGVWSHIEHRRRDGIGQAASLIGKQEGLRATINAEADSHQPTALSLPRPGQSMGMARSGLQTCLLDLSKLGNVDTGLHRYVEEGNRVLQRHFGIEGFKLIKNSDKTAQALTIQLIHSRHP